MWWAGGGYRDVLGFQGNAKDTFWGVWGWKRQLLGGQGVEERTIGWEGGGSERTWGDEWWKIE